MKKFCVKCGVEESSDIYIIDGLCPKCFIEVHVLSKKIENIKIRYCSKCGAILHYNKWINVDENSFRDIAKGIVLNNLNFGEKVRIVDIVMDLTPYEDIATKVKVMFELNNKFQFQYELPIEIRWIKAICPLCLKKAGGYNSIVQIRYVNWSEDVAKFINEIANTFREYIYDIEEVRNGYDIKLIDTHIARRIADLSQRRWKNIKIIESYGDSKRLRNGSRYSRLYISIRILNFKKGDYIVLDGKPYTVVNVNERSIAVADQNGILHRISINELTLKYMKSHTKRST